MRTLSWLVASLLVAGCSSGISGVAPPGEDDTGTPAADSGTVGDSTGDSARGDSTATDTGGTGDSGALDGGSVDGGVGDAISGDAVSSDAGPKTCIVVSTGESSG